MKNSKPRILIAAGIYPPDPGGPATHANAQFEWFKKEGYSVAVVALAHYRHLPRWIRHLFFLFNLFRAGFSSDLIYAHDAWGTGFPAWLVAFTLRKPIMLRVGGDIPWERATDSNQTDLSMNEWYLKGLHQKNMFFYFSRFVLKRMDRVVVTSDLLRNIYIAYYRVKEERIITIPNPIPTIEIKNDEPQKKTIIYASRLVAYKNLSLVLNTMSWVFKDHRDVTFVVMGDGPERMNLEALAKHLGIEKNVLFLGVVPQSEVLKQTAACLFALAPALTEFNPNYVLQTLAYNKPFLISKENDFPFKVPELLEFNPRDIDELEERINLLLTTEGYRQAKSLVTDINFKMSWEDCLRANQGIIDELWNKLG